ncbi:HIRA-interacting protein 3-like isoform X2 [Acanthaster planci]|uniref:HIRA-interacting protein 3-like isoform X2 n=1 Tax=Acanthaster planci TaxID=133434 RepID=A0A8B7YY58_ACAPL|nr:HIRA-interacting protein 3-like isoform X2 [Acanthaster planci]
MQWPMTRRDSPADMGSGFQTFNIMAATKKRKRILLPESSSESEQEDWDWKTSGKGALTHRLRSVANVRLDVKRMRQEEVDSDKEGGAVNKLSSDTSLSDEEEDGDESEDHENISPVYVVEASPRDDEENEDVDSDLDGDLKELSRCQEQKDTSAPGSKASSSDDEDCDVASSPGDQKPSASNSDGHIDDSYDDLDDDADNDCANVGKVSVRVGAQKLRGNLLSSSNDEEDSGSEELKMVSLHPPCTGRARPKAAAKEISNTLKDVKRKVPAADFESPRTLALKSQMRKSKPVVEIEVMDKRLLQGLSPHLVSLPRSRIKVGNRRDNVDTDRKETSAVKRKRGQVEVKEDSSEEDNKSSEFEESSEEEFSNGDESSINSRRAFIQNQENCTRSPRKSSQRVSSQGIVKGLEHSSSDENEESGTQSSSDSDEPLGKAQAKFSSSQRNSKVHLSDSDSESENELVARSNSSRVGVKRRLSKGKLGENSDTEDDFETGSEIITLASKKKAKKKSHSVERKENLFGSSKRGYVSDSDSDFTACSNKPSRISKTNSHSSKVKLTVISGEKCPRKHSASKASPRCQSKVRETKSLKNSAHNAKSRYRASESESDSGDDQGLASKFQKESLRPCSPSASDASVSSDSDSDDEPLSLKKNFFKQDPSARRGKTEMLVESSSEEEYNGAVETDLKPQDGSWKKRGDFSKQIEDSSSSEGSDRKVKKSDSSKGKRRIRWGKSRKLSTKKHLQEEETRKERTDDQENNSSSDSSSVSSSLTISSLSSVDEEEDTQKTKLNQKTKNERSSGERGDAQSRRGTSGSNGTSSANSRRDTKTAAQKQNKSLELFKKFVRQSGLRVAYVKLFADAKDEREKIKILQKVLQDAGMKGKPTLRKCSQLKERREKLAELAALNAENIIQGNSKSGRSRRRNVCSLYLAKSPGGRPQGSPSPRRAKPVDHFANLRGIISDDSSDSD